MRPATGRHSQRDGRHHTLSFSRHDERIYFESDDNDTLGIRSQGRNSYRSSLVNIADGHSETSATRPRRSHTRSHMWQSGVDGHEFVEEDGEERFCYDWTPRSVEDCIIINAPSSVGDGDQFSDECPPVFRKRRSAQNGNQSPSVSDSAFLGSNDLFGDERRSGFRSQRSLQNGYQPPTSNKWSSLEFDDLFGDERHSFVEMSSSMTRLYRHRFSRATSVTEVDTESSPLMPSSNIFRLNPNFDMFQGIASTNLASETPCPEQNGTVSLDNAALVFQGVSLPPHPREARNGRRGGRRYLNGRYWFQIFDHE